MTDYEALFLVADNLRNDGRTDEAISHYRQIATTALAEDQVAEAGKAYHLAGVAARQSVLDANSTYFRDSLVYYREAEKLYSDLNDAESLGALWRDMAVTYDRAGQAAESIPYFQKSIERLNQVSAFGQLGITYDKFGLHYYRLGDYGTAERYANKAVETFRHEPTAGFFQSTTWFDLARIKFKQKDNLGALEWAEQSLSWYAADHGEERYSRRLAQVHGLLSLIYDRLGEVKKAKYHASSYGKMIKKFDPAVVKVIHKDLNQLLET